MIKILLGLPVLLCLQSSTGYAAEIAPLKRMVINGLMKHAKPAVASMHKYPALPARPFSTSLKVSCYLPEKISQTVSVKVSVSADKDSSDDDFIEYCGAARVHYIPNIKRKHPEFANDLDKINSTFFIIRNCQQAKINHQSLTKLAEIEAVWESISKQINPSEENSKAGIDKLFAETTLLLKQKVKV